MSLECKSHGVTDGDIGENCNDEMDLENAVKVWVNDEDGADEMIRKVASKERMMHSGMSNFCKF